MHKHRHHFTIFQKTINRLCHRGRLHYVAQAVPLLPATHDIRMVFLFVWRTKKHKRGSQRVSIVVRIFFCFSRREVSGQGTRLLFSCRLGRWVRSFHKKHSDSSPSLADRCMNVFYGRVARDVRCKAAWISASDLRCEAMPQDAGGKVDFFRRDS